MLLGAIRSLSKILAKKSYGLRNFLHFSSLFVVRGRFEWLSSRRRRDKYSASEALERDAATTAGDVTIQNASRLSRSL